MGLALVERLGGFAETTGETIVKESGLQDLLQRGGIVNFWVRGCGGFQTHLQGFLDGQFSLWGGIGRGDFDLLLLDLLCWGFDWDVISSVRHSRKRSRRSEPARTAWGIERRTWIDRKSVV